MTTPEPGPALSRDGPPADATSAVYLTDADGRITGWSPGAAGVTGYTAAEVVGQHLSVLYPGDVQADGHPDADLAYATRAGRFEGETWLLRRGGARIRVDTVFTPLRSELGTVSGFACHAHDLTARTAAEGRRRARAEQLAALAVTREDVAGYGPDLATLLARIALRARELTGADAAIIELRDGVGDRARAHDGAPLFDIELGAVLFPHGEPLPTHRLHCLAYDARHESPAILGDVCDRLGVGSVRAIPILHDQVTIGWLAVLARSPHAFDEQHANTIELMSTLLGAPVAQAQAAEARRSLLAERSRAQAAQRESEARFRAAMDASLDALFIVAAVRDAAGGLVDFRLLDANRRAEELCGLAHGSAAGERLRLLPAVAGQLAPIETLATVVESRTALEQERATTDAAGGVRWIHEQIVPLDDGVTITVRDVTARVEADAEVRRARETAEAANRAKTDFVARMSHELRTPLNSVIGFSRILLRNKRHALDETELAYLSRINIAGTHLLGLINDVLDIAKIEAGRMTLETVAVDVVGVARSVITQLDAQAQAGGITLGLDAPGHPVVVAADAGKLHQVLLNIVGNALKFTPSGSVTVRIIDTLDGHGAPVRRIEVADSGVGIPPDRLGAVFDAFEQAESSTSRRYGGTGLGLSISRALSEAMGFRLEVESQLGVGSTFRVELSRPAPVTGYRELVPTQ